jgi:hypothetical protein
MRELEQLTKNKNAEMYNNSVKDIKTAIDILLSDSSSQVQIGTPEIREIMEYGSPNYTASVEVSVSGQLSSDLEMEKRFLTTERFVQTLPNSPLVSIESIDISNRKLVVFVSGFPKSAIKALENYED